jgi:hypothetical protein
MQITLSIPQFIYLPSKIYSMAALYSKYFERVLEPVGLGTL